MGSRQQPDTRPLLRAIPYFASLNDADLDQIGRSKMERRLTPGQIAFLEGDQCAGLYLIVQGQATIYRLSAEGRRQILAVLRPGDSCNEVPVVDGGPNPANLEASEACTVWIWSAAEMDRLRREILPLNEAIIHSLAARCRELVDRIYGLSFQSVTARLAAFLLQQADDLGAGRLDRQRWTQEEMAAHIGTVREMIGRALRTLQEDGLVRLNRHRIEILDREGLESLL